MKNLDKNSLASSNGFIQSLLGWIQIWLHVIYGLLILSCAFPFLGRTGKDKKIRKWSRRLLDILGIELEIEGSQLMQGDPHLIASNHISWLDIHVINAYKPISFVAKSEVAGWPIFGWMAKCLGTVFIRRDSARHAREVVMQLAQILKRESICIFPEGTSTAGNHVLTFKPNLFEAAIVSRSPVYPLSIQYFSKSSGERSEAVAFVGDMGLLESISRVIKTPILVARITILPPYPISQMAQLERKNLAIYCHDSISKSL